MPIYFIGFVDENCYLKCKKINYDFEVYTVNFYFDKFNIFYNYLLLIKL